MIINIDLSKIKIGDTIFHVKYGKCKVVDMSPFNDFTLDAYYYNSKYRFFIYNEERNVGVYITKDGKETTTDYAPSVWIE